MYLLVVITLLVGVICVLTIHYKNVRKLEKSVTDNIDSLLEKTGPNWTNYTVDDPEDAAIMVKFVTDGKFLDHRNRPILLINGLRKVYGYIGTKGYYMDSDGKIQNVEIILATKSSDSNDWLITIPGIEVATNWQKKLSQDYLDLLNFVKLQSYKLYNMEQINNSDIKPENVTGLPSTIECVTIEKNDNWLDYVIDELAIPALPQLE